MHQFRLRVLGLCVIFLAEGVASTQEYSLPTRLKMPLYSAIFASFNDEGTSLLCGFNSTDGKMLAIIWDLSAGKETRHFELPVGGLPVHDGAVSPDGKIIALSLRGGSVRLFDAVAATRICNCEGSNAAGQGLVFLPGGKLLAGAISDGGIQFWSTVTGKRINRVGQNRGFARSLAVSEDGLFVLAHHRLVGEKSPPEHFLCLWEVSTGKETWSIRQTGKEVPIGFGSWGEFSWTKGGLESGFRVRLSPMGQPFFTPGRRTAPIVADVGYKESNLFECQGKRIRDMIETNGNSVLGVRFSPVGKHAVLVGTEILIYDFPNWIAKRRTAAEKLTSKELEVIWKNLASADDGTALDALFTLRLMPKRDLIPFLNKRVPKIEAPNPSEITRWIRDLDSAVFGVREKARGSLKRQGLESLWSLQAELKRPRNLEQRRRMELLVQEIKTEAIGGETPRGMRVLDLLEEQGTPDARDLVEIMARGTPDAWLTLESAATLRRMRK